MGNRVAILIVGFALSGFLQPSIGAETSDALPKTVSVSTTYNGKPFEYRIESRNRKSEFDVLSLHYPSPIHTTTEQNNTIPAEYYLPHGVKPKDPARPAVICMHILEGDFELVRITCSQLASHGIPAVWFKLPYYGERGLPEGPEALAKDPKRFVSAMAQSLEDIRRTIDLLASRPEIDGGKIGISGISLGGITAATAAGIEPRLHRAALLLAGGDLQVIIHHARETRDLSRMIRRLPTAERTDLERSIQAADPMKHARALHDRAVAGKVLMINATEDGVIPPACSRKLAKALGISDRVVWLDGLGHYTAMAELPDILRRTTEFFAQDLPPGLIDDPNNTGQIQPDVITPKESVVSLIGQAATLLLDNPKEGRCHFASLHVTATPKGKQTLEGTLRLVRGHKWRLKLECDLPVVGRVALGQNNFPWMRAGDKRVYLGTKNSTPDVRDPFAFADPKQVLALRMAGGVATAVALAPEVLDRWIEVVEKTSGSDDQAIRVTLKEKQHGTVDILLADDRKTPREITFDVADITGKIIVRGWQLDMVAHDSLFTPPSDLPTQEVDQEQLARMFSAMFNFAMESVR